MLKEIPCSIYRGGTSKGVFFLREDLPKDVDVLKEYLLKIIGSPDKKQIDGLGGATSTTSKVAIVSKSKDPNYDVDYTFAQVAVNGTSVDMNGNCGNILSAVGPFAIENGLVEVEADETKIKIYNTNTKKQIYSYVNTRCGKVNYEGDCRISGVPGTSSMIKLEFNDPAGAVTKKLLPTGNPADFLNVKGVGQIRASIVDVTNPLIFIKAEDLGIDKDISPYKIDSDQFFLDKLELIRGTAALELGLIKTLEDSSILSPGIPKLTIIQEKKDYMAINGTKILAENIDLYGLMMSMQKTHKAYAFTGALCTAAAGLIKGTVVEELIAKNLDVKNIKIGHPDGIIEIGTNFEYDNKIKSVWGYRTARKIMEGIGYFCP